MACAARLRGTTWVCVVCSLSWEHGDRDRPACGRDGGPGQDVKLTAAEIKALKAAELQFLNRVRGGYRGAGKAGRVSQAVAHRLLAMGMVYRTRFASIRITTYGSAWLDRNTKGRPAPKGKQ